MIDAGSIRRVIARHCLNPKCWCASQTLIVYGHVNGRERTGYRDVTSYLVQEVEGEGCWVVGVGLITQFTRSTAPRRLDRLAGVDIL